MEKLRIKDLVTIGVFTVIYFVLMFASGMIGIVPILYLAYRHYNRNSYNALYGKSSKIMGIIYTWVDL